jgi:aryl-alcohol dehydrogenase-like predicted oxidoreductase
LQYGTIPGVDKPVSRLVQGTVMISTAEQDYSNSLLDEIFARGCTTFDMAHVYGQGDVERAFGNWLRQRGVRDKIVILDKGAHHNADRKRVTPHDIAADIFDSLARLQVEKIDLYLLHRDDPSVPVGPIVEALNEHQEAGRIGAFGASNWTHTRLAAADVYAAEHALTPFVVSSPHYSLAVQQREPWANCVSIAGPEQAEARAWYATQQMPVFAWSSLGGGIFSGRFRPDNLDSFTYYWDQVAIDTYASAGNFERLARVEALAADKGVSATQLVLAYALHAPFDLYALVGCRTPAEFEDNIAALSLELSADELAWLAG